MVPLCPTIQTINEYDNHYQPQYWSPGHITGGYPLARFHATDHSMSLEVQPVVNTPHSLLI